MYMKPFYQIYISSVFVGISLLRLNLVLLYIIYVQFKCIAFFLPALISHDALAVGRVNI